MYKFLKIIGVPMLLACLLLPMLVSCGECKHKESEWEVTVEATCSVAGTRVKKCTECDAELEREQYEINHLYEEGSCIYCKRAQYGAAYLEYGEITLDGEAGYEVIGYGNSTALAVEIPALRNGKPVLSVRAGAFAGNNSITSVSFGSNVKWIGEKAFSGCKALESVSFHENSELEVIGGAAFEGCVSLKAFAVPTGVSAISAQMLKGCTALEELTLHSGINEIGENALEGCDSITYSEENGAKYLGAAQAPHLLLVEILDKEIASFAVPNDTKIIGTGAFLGCASLGAITLPEGVLSLSSYAFAACTSLAQVSLPSTLQNIGAYAFAECAALTQITIPSTTAHIGEKAFYKCSTLSAIELPSGMKTVGAFAFLNTALSYTDWNGGKYLGNTENPYLVLLDTASGITALTVHEKTRVIANGALSDSDGAALLSITLGTDVITLGAGAFVGCASLEELVFTTSEGWKIGAAYGENRYGVTVQDGSWNAEAITKSELKNYYWYR
ncbi:MAG: leucine-rich repeat domain-containing protein [Clostridia bacterium]|nr:leucine-rich repeat domain-containing protein [Clostridia bacterium]